jgi:Raf kinase inhibitor-like YbhB/YbcL family protein
MSHLKNMTLTCCNFEDGEPIPREYTGDGRNDSPPLWWSDPPEGTVSFALVCDDPDAPRGTFTHWVLFDLPGHCRELKAAVSGSPTLPNGARQGLNGFGRLGYAGPAPPPGKPHHYVFELYALDAPLGLDSGATREQVLEQMHGHQLARGKLIGVYERPEARGGADESEATHEEPRRGGGRRADGSAGRGGGAAGGDAGPAAGGRGGGAVRPRQRQQPAQPA